MSHPAVLTGRIMRLIAERLKSEVRSGRTILVITHNRELIESCCVAFLHSDQDTV